MPASRRSSVVLPTPLGPTTPRRVRGPTATSTASSTVNEPWALARPRATSENEDEGEELEDDMRDPKGRERTASRVGSAGYMEVTVAGGTRAAVRFPAAGRGPNLAGDECFVAISSPGTASTRAACRAARHGERPRSRGSRGAGGAALDGARRLRAVAGLDVG